MCDAGLALGDVIETVLLQYAVKLLPNLGHHNDSVRRATVQLFVQLAAAFDPGLWTLPATASLIPSTGSGLTPRLIIASTPTSSTSASSSSSSSSATDHKSRAVALNPKAMALIDAVATDEGGASRCLPRYSPSLTHLHLVGVADVFHGIHMLFTGSRRAPSRGGARQFAAPATTSSQQSAGIGESLAVIALALVSEVEAQYLHPDSRVRVSQTYQSFHMCCIDPKYGV